MAAGSLHLAAGRCHPRPAHQPASPLPGRFRSSEDWTAMDKGSRGAAIHRSQGSRYYMRGALSHAWNGAARWLGRRAAVQACSCEPVNAPACVSDGSIIRFLDRSPSLNSGGAIPGPRRAELFGAKNDVQTDAALYLPEVTVPIHHCVRLVPPAPSFSSNLANTVNSSSSIQGGSVHVHRCGVNSVSQPVRYVWHTDD